MFENLDSIQFTRFVFKDLIFSDLKILHFSVSSELEELNDDRSHLTVRFDDAAAAATDDFSTTGTEEDDDGEDATDEFTTATGEGGDDNCSVDVICIDDVTAGPLPLLVVDSTADATAVESLVLLFVGCCCCCCNC